MRVLVTGGAGYIGGVITDELIERGHEVTVIDNLSKGHRDAVSEAAHLREIDLLDFEAVSDTLASRRIDAVIHMAASSLVSESMSAPERYYRNNVIASLTLFEAMLRTGVTRIVFSSTAAVYGEPAKQPIMENDPTAPSNTYGETKLAIEKALHWYGRAHGIGSICLRYFNAAGATDRRGERHQPETHLIPLVLDAAYRRQGGVTVFGADYPTRDGTCIRDYIHVEDLARAHIRALDVLQVKAGSSDVFNLGAGEGHTVREVIATARHVTGCDIPEQVTTRRAGDPAVLIAESRRANAVLGWAPQCSSLEHIMGSAWAWITRTAQPRDSSLES